MNTYYKLKAFNRVFVKYYQKDTISFQLVDLSTYLCLQVANRKLTCLFGYPL